MGPLAAAGVERANHPIATGAVVPTELVGLGGEGVGLLDFDTNVRHPATVPGYSYTGLVTKDELDAYVAKVVADAPPLTDEQLREVVALLRAGKAKTS